MHFKYISNHHALQIHAHHLMRKLSLVNGAFLPSLTYNIVQDKSKEYTVNEYFQCLENSFWKISLQIYYKSIYMTIRLSSLFMLVLVKLLEAWSYRPIIQSLPTRNSNMIIINDVGNNFHLRFANCIKYPKRIMKYSSYYEKQLKTLKPNLLFLKNRKLTNALTDGEIWSDDILWVYKENVS